MLASKIFKRIAVGIISGFALLQLLVVLFSYYPDRDLVLAIFLSWVVGFLGLEILALVTGKRLFPRAFMNFSYGPIAILAIAIGVVMVSDQVFIAHSKYQIRSYVYGNASPHAEIDFDLHNDYRGWCGNGYSAREYDLYAETAAEGFASGDPEVRARSLRATINVYDLWNGRDDGPLPEMLRQAMNDEDSRVYGIASSFLIRHPQYRL